MSLLEANDFIVQKKILSTHEHYDFLDLQGNKLGEADGNFIQIPPKFEVKDAHGAGLLRMQGKALSLHREFTIYDSGGGALATIKKKLVTFAHQEYLAEKDGAESMRIHGDFTNHEYQMDSAGQNVAVVHRRWVSMRDQMGVSIIGSIDHRTVIGVAIIIEHIEVTQKQSSSGFNVGI